jgi:hypothetical protein
MSHSFSHASHASHAKEDKPAAKATTAAPRDTSADQLQLLLFLARDWLNGDRTHNAEIARLTASLTAAQAPPVNVDVPYASQAGAMLACTMGNWHGEPASYAYAWHRDGVAVDAATGATYAVQPDDVGHGFACVVTATNALGSTVAPMSNTVTVV